MKWDERAAREACERLVAAYRAGEESGGSVEWDAVDEAHAAACRALGLGPEDAIRVGDRVVSYDFTGREDCYIEGVVEADDTSPPGLASECRHYRIRVERQIFQGAEIDPVATHVYPPVNGTPNSLGGVCLFVRRIEDGKRKE